MVLGRYFFFFTFSLLFYIISYPDNEFVVICNCPSTSTSVRRPLVRRFLCKYIIYIIIIFVTERRMLSCFLYIYSFVLFFVCPSFTPVSFLGTNLISLINKSYFLPLFNVFIFIFVIYKNPICSDSRVSAIDWRPFRKSAVGHKTVRLLKHPIVSRHFLNIKFLKFYINILLTLLSLFSR